MSDNITYSSGAKLKQSRQCLVTKGWCANEKWEKDKPCKCDECQAWICETIDHLNRLAEESMRIYDSYSKGRTFLHQALQAIASDKNPGTIFRDTKAYSLLYSAMMS